MVKLNKIANFLENIAPSCLAEDYDNVGLLIGDNDKSISKILVALDADEAVVNEAKNKKCDLVISHHPLIFKPLKKVVTDDSVSRTVIDLIKNDISLISIHTNFDSVKSGLCDLFLDKIADTKERTAIEGDEENGLGRIAQLTNPAKLSDILETVRREYKIDALRYVGNPQAVINKIAVCNGGGADFIYSAAAQGADIYISGDIKYHHARFAYENGISLIEIPHYNAEIIFCDYIKEILKKEFGDELDICTTDQNIDVWNIF